MNKAEIAQRIDEVEQYEALLDRLSVAWPSDIDPTRSLTFDDISNDLEALAYTATNFEVQTRSLALLHLLNDLTIDYNPDGAEWRRAARYAGVLRAAPSLKDSPMGIEAMLKTVRRRSVLD